LTYARWRGNRRIALAFFALVLVSPAVLFVRGSSLRLFSRGSSPRTFAVATAYTRRPPRFTAGRTLHVSDADALRRAVRNLRVGDEVVVERQFDVKGEFVISRRLAPPGALIDLGRGASAAHFDYGGRDNVPSVWIRDSTNLRLSGGDVTNPTGGDGIELTGGTSHVTWWDFLIHDVGGSGLAELPGGSAIDHTDMEGKVTRWGLVPARDPHRIKGTGVHAAILADVAGAVFDDNRVAIQAAAGAGDAVEIGNPTPAGEIERDTVIVEASDLYHPGAGNGLQLWGRVPIGLDVPYLVTHHTQGRAVDTNGVSAGVSMAGVRIRYGRAFDCCRDPKLGSEESPTPGELPWDPRFGVRYADVVPRSR